MYWSIGVIKAINIQGIDFRFFNPLDVMYWSIGVIKAINIQGITARCQDDKWIRKNLEEKVAAFNAQPRYFPGVNEESQERTVIVASITAGIPSELLDNESQKDYL
jgi:hypothetical protein